MIIKKSYESLSLIFLKLNSLLFTGNILSKDVSVVQLVL